VLATPRLSFALDQFQERALWSIRSTPADRTPLRTDVTGRLPGRLSASASIVESRAAAVLVEAFEANGGVAAVNTEREARFDLGLWSDDLEAIGGNPLFVETKLSLVPGAVSQVVRGLNAHPCARLALLVTSGRRLEIGRRHGQSSIGHGFLS